MKTYISLFLISTFFTLQAQEIIVPLEDQLTYNESNAISAIYYKDTNNYLNKFTGDWVFNDGTHYLKISATKKIHISKGFSGFNDPNFEDELVITMIYKLNGVEIYNTYPNANTIFTRNPKINGNIIVNSNIIKLHYYEPTSSCRRQKSASLTLEFIPSGIITQTGSLPSGTLKWTRESRLSYTSPQEECPDGSLIDSSNFKIPNELILVRQ